jgi:O-antigen ligase/polysaccharide polymerase Wzy-like membrane protein
VPSARTISARAAAAGLLAMPTAVAFSAGGFFEGARLRAGIIVWATVALLVLITPRPLAFARSTRIALAGLAGLAVWTAISIAWSPLHDAALGDAERVWLYLGYGLVAALVLRGPTVRWVEPAIAGGAALVGAYAVATRLVPGVVPSEHSLSAGARLDQPLTYWNALGLLMAMAVVLLVRLAAASDRPGWMRSTSAALVPVTGLVLYLTFSRGALAALAVGVIVLLVLCRDRRTVAIAITGLGCAAAAAVAASRFPAVDSLDGPASKQGAAMLAILLGLCLVAVALHHAIERGVADRLRLRSATGAGAAVVILVLAIGGLVALTRSPEAPAAAPANTKGGVQLPRDRARLATLKTNRPSYWKVALRGFVDEPLTGVGAHGFQQLWLQKRHIAESVQDAHSLYLETAAELGVIGVLLLLTWLGGVAGAVVRLIGLPGGRMLVAGWIAASAAYLVHAGLDWDWEMPAVTLPFLALTGAALGAAADREVDRHGSEDDQRRLDRDPEPGDPVHRHRDDADRDDERQERPDREAPAT